MYKSPLKISLRLLRSLPPPTQYACYIPLQFPSLSNHRTTITFSGDKLFGMVDTCQVELNVNRSTTAGSVSSIEHRQRRYPWDFF